MEIIAEALMGQITSSCIEVPWKITHVINMSFREICQRGSTKSSDQGKELSRDFVARSQNMWLFQAFWGSITEKHDVPPSWECKVIWQLREKAEIVHLFLSRLEFLKAAFWALLFFSGFHQWSLWLSGKSSLSLCWWLHPLPYNLSSLRLASSSFFALYRSG